MTEERNGVDFDFEKFCNALKAENPDMDLIKAGVEKYGTGQLSDSQKEQFLKAMFPADTDAKEYSSLGFKNMVGIKNALVAMNDLKSEGKINNDAMLQFLTETNPKGGRSVMTTIALNTYAAEYKMAHTQNEEIKNMLETKMNDLTAIQNTFKNIDDDVLAQAICTPDDSKGIGEAYAKRVKYKDFAERAIRISEKQSDGVSKDSVLKENYERVKDKLAEIEARQAQQSAEAERSNAPENTDALNVAQTTDDANFKVAGTQNNPQPLNVEKEEEEKTADITPAPQEDPSKHGDIKMDRIRECDIIDFMFNDWFLASVNWGAEKLLNLTNDALHNALRPKSPAPSTSKKENEKVDASQQVLQSHQNTINYAQSEGIISSLSKQINENAYSPAEIASVFERTLDDIKLHKGKDPKDWTPCKAVDPVRHAKLIAVWNAKYRENPEAFNKLIEERITAIKTIAPQQLANVSKMAAMYAFLDYATKTGNIDKKLDGSARKKIYSKSKLFTSDLLKTGVLVQQAETEKYLLTHPELGLAPNTPFATLSPEAKNEIGRKAEERFSKYLVNLAGSAAQSMESVVKCVETKSDDEKKAIKKQLKDSHSGIQEIIAGFGQPLPNEEPVRNQERTENKPRDLRAAAVENNKADEHEKKVTDATNRNKGANESKREKTKERKEKFMRGKNKIRGNTGRNFPDTRTLADVIKTNHSRF